MSSQGQYIRLETRGRKTGRPHVVEVRYASVGSAFFAIAGRSGSDWVRNALTSMSANVRLGELLYHTSVRIASETESRKVMESFTKKYGHKMVREWYSGSWICICFEPVGLPSRPGTVRGELAVSTTLAQWRSRQTDYYAAVASAFDSASEEYDFTISNNFINTWIRRRSIDKVLQYAASEDVLVEVGCGTGAEAIQIARMVKGIIAMDISQSMIELLSVKVSSRRMQDKITPIRLRASEIAQVKEYLPAGKTRLVYSLNGALNCEPRLDSFIDGLASLIEPGGHFICSVRNTFSLSESIAHALVLQFGKVNPRKRQPMFVSVGGQDIPSTYYSPHRFSNHFECDFSVQETIALPALLPPAYLNDYYVRARTFLSPLERIDSALSGYFPLNLWGDQTLFVFRRRNHPQTRASLLSPHAGD
jgi:2-polyprenyl-3-methyl-5-hydroxy-6-metoxy-1,4-benzoquinol methylase